MIVYHVMELIVNLMEQNVSVKVGHKMVMGIVFLYAMTLIVLCVFKMLGFVNNVKMQVLF